MTKICDHTSVGMLVWNDGKLLLIERKKEPYGFAPPAGHVDGDIDFETAAKRELKEEVGLGSVDLVLLGEGRKENPCRREDGSWHMWKIYEVDATGNIDTAVDEVVSYRFVTKDDLKDLAERTKEYLNGEISQEDWKVNPGLEPVWRDWLNELSIL